MNRFYVFVALISLVGFASAADMRFTLRPPKVIETIDRRDKIPKWRKGLDPEFVELKRYEIEVEFPGEGNGIVEIPGVKDRSLRVRTAPEDGYESTMLLFDEQHYERSSTNNYNIERGFFHADAVRE